MELEELIQKLNDGLDITRSKAAFELRNYKDPRAVESLIKLLRNDLSSSVRTNAADSLGEIGDKRAVEPLLEAMEKDENDGVRGSAAGALGKLGDARALEPFLLALEGRGRISRETAIVCLGMIGDKRAAKSIIRFLKDKTYKNKFGDDIRWQVAIVLGLLGDSSAVKPIIDFFKNEESHYPHVVRRALLELLVRAEDDCVLTLLTEALGDSVFRKRWIDSWEKDPERDERISKLAASIKFEEPLVNMLKKGYSVEATLALLKEIRSRKGLHFVRL